MRSGLALVLALALAVQPAIAQTKTKTSPVDAAMSALEICESFAKGDVLAVDEASAAGWDAYEEAGEGPFVRSFSAGREMSGIGWADIFGLVETYPSRSFGYCRLDAYSVTGNGSAIIDAIVALDRYDGEVRRDDMGVYASLQGTDGTDAMLLTQWADGAFVIQLTILTPKAGE